MNHIYSEYFNTDSKLLAILIDPEKQSKDSLQSLLSKINKSNIDLIFIGGSLSSKAYDKIIEDIKSECSKPVILFPGNSLQLSSRADALLNLSLISGRNPEFLIGEHVKSAAFVKKSKLEVIPTGYILIDGGTKTSVEYISNTQAIPNNKIDIAIATALAGQFLGLKCIYLEAGSGAEQTVPEEMIASVCENIDIPIICGGGIKSIEGVKNKWNAGANIVVIGTAFENNPDFLLAFPK